MNRDIINQVYDKYVKKLDKIAKYYNSKITSYRVCRLYSEAQAIKNEFIHKADKLRNKLMVLNLLLEIEEAENKEKLKGKDIQSVIIDGAPKSKEDNEK